MGRRQFLFTAGAASTTALAWKKFSGIRTASAFASENTDAGSAGGGYSDRYPHLLSPLKIRNKVLKNRILQPRSDPHLLQGPENFPADATRSFYSEIAKNAAIVSIHTRFNENVGIFPKWDDIPAVHNYFDQLIEDIHCEGSLVGIGELGGDTIEDIVTSAKEWEDKGYDVVGLEQMFGGKGELEPYLEKLQAIRSATDLLIVTFLSPYSPEFPWLSWASSGSTSGGAAGGGGMPPGGPMPEGGMRGEAMPEEGMRGEGMPGGGARGEAMSGRGMRGGGNSGTSSGPDLEEVVEIAKMLDGATDILLMKPSGQKHQNSFTMERDKPWTLPFAQAIKESGANIITCPNGGFHDPTLNDAWIASGKTDMIAMATSLIADPEYVKKVSEDRVEDIVPCLKCHDCHAKISTSTGACISICNVNPTHGLSETKKRSIRPPARSRKVAVIGGGPGGMLAAITAADSGHQVTLYEKESALGGLQRHVDYTEYRWAYRDYKDYLIRQVEKAGIAVKLNTAATPSMIKARAYDAVLVGVGAEPAVSKIPGADGKVFYKDAAGSEKSVKADSVVVYTGLRPKTDEAMTFSGSARQVFLLGDCTGKGGTLQKTIRSAYFVASQV